MEFKQMGHTHNVNPGSNEGSQVPADCLGVPLILRKILEQLSNADLLSLSLVNKVWKYEARSVMRKRDSFTASLKFSDDSTSCQSLANFASELHQMNVVPFSGMSFQLGPGESHVCEPWSIAEPLDDSSLKIILGSLQWKHLSVTLLSGSCRKCTGFPGFRSVVKTILKDKCGVLEELSLSLDTRRRGEFIQAFLLSQGCSFPSLKVLKLGQLQKNRPSDEDAENMKALLLLTPKLQELRIPDWCVDIQKNVIQATASSAVILTNCFLMNYLGPFQYCCHEILDVVRFERMILGSWPGLFNAASFDFMIPDLLQRSRTTLRSLCLHAALAVPLMSYGISLDKVQKLTICLDFNGNEPEFMNLLMNLLKACDFTRTFPNLDRVITGYFGCGSPADDEVFDILELANELRKESWPNRAVKIKHLTVSKTLNESFAPFLAEMLPHIEIISVDPIESYIPFGLIWEYWADLKQLYVQSYHMERGRSEFVNGSWSDGRMPNLDSDFCGIYPEEVAQLRMENDEYLRKVNIVPVKPSIGCLKDLRTFTCYLQPRVWPVYKGMRDPPVLSLTQVTGLIAFARCPNIVVTLQTVTIHDAEELCHMRPYASVVPVGPNIWPWSDMNIDRMTGCSC